MTDYPLTVVRDITQPPGGWTMTVPQTGFTLRAASAHSLARKVMTHMRANSLEIPPDFDDWVRNEICTQMYVGEPFCGPPVPRRTGVMPFLTRGKASRFLKTMMAVVRERRFVPRAEAERRMSVCMACPLATSLGGCLGCDSAFIKVARMMKNNPVKAGPGKEFCAACGCLVEVKVWIDNGTLDGAEKGDKPPYDTGCWRLSD
jgi:hypothetical protein